MSDIPTWSIIQTQFDPAKLHHSETIFTIGNGYFGTRGAFEEVYPGEERSTFLHGVFDDVPVTFTELANAPDWLELEIILAGERFGLERGEVLDFKRSLDLKTAVLTREVRWRSPQGRTTHLAFERFASLADEHLAGIRVRITPQDYEGKIEVHAGVNAAADNLGLKHWQSLDQGLDKQTAWLNCRTRATQIDLALGIYLTLQADRPVRFKRWNVRDHPTLVATAQAKAGETLLAQKWAAYYTGRDTQDPLSEVKRYLNFFYSLDWEQALTNHCQSWAAEWERCDVIIEGDPAAQQAIRFNLFQLLNAAPRHDERVNIGAKCLSGYGYRGHSFWDTEIFMLPFFTYTRPEIARNLLSYRYHNLAGARQKALGNGLRGAQYPWESAGTGEEVTPTWVQHYADRTKLIRIWTGDIEIHISADVAYAIWQYWQATGDDAFLEQRGAEVILETARYWANQVEWVPDMDRYEISDVVGPDEYHDHVDNNFYTNAMARWNLQTALSVIDWLKNQAPQTWESLSQALALKPIELERWQHVIDHIYIAYAPKTRLIAQFDGYFQRKDVSLESFEPRAQSIQAILGIEEACQTQVLKQPDVLMLLYLLPELFDHETLRVNYAYYTPRTDLTYGSSLGPSIQAILAAWMQDHSAAHENFWRAAQADLYDVRSNAGDGIHGASAGGLWQAIVFGFAGLRRGANGWETHPCLPLHWTRVAFKIMDHGELVSIEVKPE